MTRRRLDVNPTDYGIHYRTRRWSVTLIIAKTLRWLAARINRSARRSGATSARVLCRGHGFRPVTGSMTAAIRRGHDPLRARGLSR